MFIVPNMATWVGIFFHSWNGFYGTPGTVLMAGTVPSSKIGLLKAYTFTLAVASMTRAF